MKRIFKFGVIALITAAMFSVVANADNVSPVSVTDSSTKISLDTPLSPGISVIAYSNPLTVSGIKGEDITFSAEIFNDYIGYVPASVTILSLPNPDAGVLTGNSESISVGDSVSVLNLSELTYSPSSDSEAEFCFSPDGINTMVCKIRPKDSSNIDPRGAESGTVTTWTRLDTSVKGNLIGSDSDGDTIHFEITSYPVLGIVELTDPASGTYIYHPYEGISGTDSFKYRVRDAFGGYSEDQTVTINVEKKNAVVYDDIADSHYIAAINEAVERGLMKTRETSDGVCFDPAEPVSRIEFLIMAMKTMGAKDVSSAASTAFCDDGTLSDAEKGYLSLAYKLGIVKGTNSEGVLYFNPDEAITGNEAAVMINAVLGLSESDSVSASAIYDSVPAWAEPSVSALTGAGIINTQTLSPSSALTRENAAVILSIIDHRLG